MNQPRTAREALIAETLGELDVLLTRVETLTTLVADAEIKISNTVCALNDAGDKYRVAVAVFNEHAKAELTEYLDRKTTEVSAKTVEEQRAAIQEAAYVAFQSEASNIATRLKLIFDKAAKEFHRTKQTRLLENTITSLITSCVTAFLVYMIIKIN